MINDESDENLGELLKEKKKERWPHRALITDTIQVIARRDSWKKKKKYKLKTQTLISLSLFHYSLCSFQTMDVFRRVVSGGGASRGGGYSSSSTGVRSARHRPSASSRSSSSALNHKHEKLEENWSTNEDPVEDGLIFFLKYLGKDCNRGVGIMGFGRRGVCIVLLLRLLLWLMKFIWLKRIW